jgi:hypothetical protein
MGLCEERGGLLPLQEIHVSLDELEVEQVLQIIQEYPLE